MGSASVSRMAQKARDPGVDLAHVILRDAPCISAGAVLVFPQGQR